MSSLQEQVVLVTGCSTGIGRALARELRAGGHRTFATARRLESIADLASDGIDLVALAGGEAAEHEIAGDIPGQNAMHSFSDCVPRRTQLFTVPSGTERCSASSEWLIPYVYIVTIARA